MSNRGSLAKNGHVTSDNYQTIKVTQLGVKILKGIGNNHSLPEYSHSPNSIYAKMNPDGSLRCLRFLMEKGFRFLR